MNATQRLKACAKIERGLINRLYASGCAFSIFRLENTGRNALDFYITWFVRIMPVMLEEFRDRQIGDSDEETRRPLDEDLDRMIFLFREVAEETCSKQNPYSDEYDAAWEAFEKRYGIMGTGMDADGGTKNRQFPTVHFPDELEEYRPICERYEQAEREIEDYRQRCEQEALKLFAKRFRDLWI